MAEVCVCARDAAGRGRDDGEGGIVGDLERRGGEPGTRGRVGDSPEALPLDAMADYVRI